MGLVITPRMPSVKKWDSVPLAAGATQTVGLLSKIIIRLNLMTSFAHLLPGGRVHVYQVRVTTVDIVKTSSCDAAAPRSDADQEGIVLLARAPRVRQIDTKLMKVMSLTALDVHRQSVLVLIELSALARLGNTGSSQSVKAALQDHLQMQDLNTVNARSEHSGMKTSA